MPTLRAGSALENIRLRPPVCSYKRTLDPLDECYGCYHHRSCAPTFFFFFALQGRRLNKTIVGIPLRGQKPYFEQPEKSNPWPIHKNYPCSKTTMTKFPQDFGQRNPVDQNIFLRQKEVYLNSSIVARVIHAKKNAISGTLDTSPPENKKKVINPMSRSTITPQFFFNEIAGFETTAPGRNA